MMMRDQSPTFDCLDVNKDGVIDRAEWSRRGGPRHAHGASIAASHLQDEQFAVLSRLCKHTFPVLQNLCNRNSKSGISWLLVDGLREEVRTVASQLHALHEAFADSVERSELQAEQEAKLRAEAEVLSCACSIMLSSVCLVQEGQLRERTFFCRRLGAEKVSLGSGSGTRGGSPIMRQRDAQACCLIGFSGNVCTVDAYPNPISNPHCV